MIIQCDKCQTKFRLDDSRLKDTGVKVRCAKCRNVFKVFKDDQETGQRPDFGEMLDDSVGSASGVGEFFPEPEVAAEKTEAEGVAEAAVTESAGIEFEDSFGSGSETSEFFPEPEAAAEPLHLEKIPEPTFAEPAGVDAFDSTIEFDSAAFAMPQDESEESAVEKPVDVAAEAAPMFGDATASGGGLDFGGDSNEVDFGGFDFGEAAAPAEDHDKAAPSFDFGSAALNEAPQAAPAAPAKKEYGGLDFSDDDMFGEVVPQAAEEKTEAITFDLGMDGFADAMKNDDGFSGRKASPGEADLSMDSSYSIDDIDFGDDLTAVALQQVNPDELKPSQELLFGPLAASDSESRTGARAEAGIAPETSETPVSPPPAVEKQELPPLSITSRRKQGPISSGMMAAVGIVIAAALAFVGYSLTTDDSSKPTKEAGKIAIRAVEASYVKSKSAGDLLVISGEAVNEYNKPRAAIQVKGMVFGANGQVIGSKNAFCGNPLTPQQLSGMNMEKIEAAMANQFGDSLANMEVAPGKAIQFVIVMAKPDKAAKDYGVEPAGSTVAGAK